MLVLTRSLSDERTADLCRQNEIVITCPSGERIVVKVLWGRSGSQVRVGIDAPAVVRIMRGEISDEHNRREGQVPLCAAS